MEKRDYRVKITNFPHFLGPQNVKKFIKSCLGKLSFRKLKFSGTIAFVSFDLENDADKAVGLLNFIEFKKNRHLYAKRVADNSIKLKQEDNETENAKTASQLVTPLANMDYSEQLELKYAESKKLINKLRRQFRQANIFDLPDDAILHKILPSPIIEGYRNKCEFTVGFSEDINEYCNHSSDKIVVGFVSGKMANRKYQIMPVHDCINLSKNTRAIVDQFQILVREFGEKPFDEFNRNGFWKMLTVKDFYGDSMIIVTVYPHLERDVSTRAKQALVDCFFSPKMSTNKPLFKFNVNSIYWLEQKNASDKQHLEHIAGTPYIYESLLGLRFRISSSTFFQTNTRAAAVLYTKIGDLLNLPKSYDHNINNELVDNDINFTKTKDVANCPINSIKKIKIENMERRDVNQMSTQQNPIVILDICCGAGSISLCLLERIRNAIKFGYHSPVSYGCIGVELNVGAVRDAKRNAHENGFDLKNCVYIDGEAEIVFKDLQYHMPKGCIFENVTFLGIIDPPRAGVSDKVIIGCRKLIQMNCLIYVSCDPKSAVSKNICDLCRPSSRKFEGEPFRIVGIYPVDMFPHTEHFEWIIKLERFVT